MRIVHGLDEFPAQGGDSVLALGTFDGLHVGHQKVIGEAVTRAGEVGLQSAVVTFDPHPLEILRPSVEPILLTIIEERFPLLERLGVDLAVVLGFDLGFSRTPAQVWLDEILTRRLRARTIFVGSSYTFGHRREGTAARLTEWGRAHGVEVHLVPAALVRGEPVSSSRIRSALREGLVDEAAHLLGRYYSVLGRVVPGQGRGRTIGFPTANLLVPSPRKILPGRGVYATIVETGGRRYGGATNIGYRPTFGGGDLSVETHLLDYDGPLVDKPMRLEFVGRVRSERAFPSAAALTAQIREDVVRVRELLAEAQPSIIR
ncbi:MAG TPA: bifunctional riboflavin kinase/FAD synthetase [bacterium]|nr:bifunctional riboflavin kinase/FAD synthetase [bacterium]